MTHDVVSRRGRDDAGTVSRISLELLMVAIVVLATAGCTSGLAKEVQRGLRGRRRPTADRGLIDELDGVRFRADVARRRPKTVSPVPGLA